MASGGAAARLPGQGARRALPGVPGAAERGRAGLAHLAEPLAIFAAVRASLVVLAYSAMATFPGPGYATRIWAFGGLLDAWARWDAGWYLRIAEEGYKYDPAAPVSGVAFFPLYPLLIRAAAPLVGSRIVAGLLVSNLALAAASCLLYSLVAARLGRPTARRTLLLLSCFPYSLFLGAVYTEGLFLCLAVLAFWLAERRRWWLAGLAAGLCGATRLVGATLAPALALLYLEQAGWRVRLRRDALALALAPAGLAAYMLYQYGAFGDPLAMVRSSTSWGRYNPFVDGLARLDPGRFGPGNYDLVLGLNLAAALVWLLAAIPVGRLLGPAYGAFVLLAVLIPLSQQTDSLGRFMGVLFPVFVVAAHHVRARLAFNLLLAASSLGLSLMTILFANGYWVM